MQIRDQLSLNRCWPPAWMRINGSGDKNLNGEVGILRRVELSRIEPIERCYLLMDHDASSYMGTLVFDDDAFCRQVYSFLQRHTGRTIQQVGDLELSFTRNKTSLTVQPAKN
jgi:hypothetical protein